MKPHSRPTLIVSFVICTLLLSVGYVRAAAALQTSGGRVIFPVQLRWNAGAGSGNYRLQIASDDKFRDILFDGPVRGEHYVVDKVEPGSYYWRVAPIQNGPLTFSTPVKFFISGGTLTSFANTPRNHTSQRGAAASHSRKKGKQ